MKRTRILEQEKKLLFLAVATQAIIDEMDEEIGHFRFKHKQTAKAFFDESLKIMNRDFNDMVALDQLINLTVWIKDVYDIMIKIGERTEIEQQAFQIEWEELLKKYAL